MGDLGVGLLQVVGVGVGGWEGSVLLLGEVVPGHPLAAGGQPGHHASGLPSQEQESAQELDRLREENEWYGQNHMLLEEKYSDSGYEPIFEENQIVPEEIEMCQLKIELGEVIDPVLQTIQFFFRLYTWM